jgi:hypothetical protein
MAILEPTLIVDHAVAVLNGLRRYAGWKTSLEDAVVLPSPMFVTSIAPLVGKFGETQLRLPDYFIVSIHRDPGISARFAHDAETGELLEAEGVRKAGAVFKPYVDPLEVMRSHTTGAPRVTPDAVWRPCNESTGRFLPFWRLQIQSRTVYLRADGAVFYELTTNSRG